MVDGFDAVAGGVGDKRAVVAGAVFGSWPGLSEVGVACVSHRLPPAADLVAIGGGEGDVETAGNGTLVGGLRDREVVPLEVLLALGEFRPVEQLQCECVEGTPLVEVCHADPQVVDHTAEATPVVVLAVAGGV